MEAKIRAKRGGFMGKWKSEGLVLHEKEKSKGGFLVEKRKDLRAEKERGKNQREGS